MVKSQADLHARNKRMCSYRNVGELGTMSKVLGRAYNDYHNAEENAFLQKKESETLKFVPNLIMSAGISQLIPIFSLTYLDSPYTKYQIYKFLACPKKIVSSSSIGEERRLWPPF